MSHLKFPQILITSFIDILLANEPSWVINYKSEDNSLMEVWFICRKMEICNLLQCTD